MKPPHANPVTQAYGKTKKLKHNHFSCVHLDVLFELKFSSILMGKVFIHLDSKIQKCFVMQRNKLIHKECTNLIYS